MSYAQPSDLIARYDVRRLGDLVNDDGTRASSSDLLNNNIIQMVLDEASGMIDAAIQRGQRYSPTDLATLLTATQISQPSTNIAAASLWNGQQLLFRLNCDLAYGLLVGRRAYSASDTEAQAPRYVEAMRLLERLENGEWIFTTSGALASGVPIPNVQISQNVQLLSSLYRVFGDLAISPYQNYPMYSSFNRE